MVGLFETDAAEWKVMASDGVCLLACVIGV